MLLICRFIVEFRGFACQKLPSFIEWKSEWQIHFLWQKTQQQLVFLSGCLYLKIESLLGSMFSVRTSFAIKAFQLNSLQTQLRLKFLSKKLGRSRCLVRMAHTNRKAYNDINTEPVFGGQ